MKYPVQFELELNKNPYPGLYIAFEGIDGSGKTTQSDELKKYFEETGREVIETGEPRRTGEIGEMIHGILKKDSGISRIALQYLFSADRASHQEELIIPALKSGKVIVSDRTFWSSVAYGIMDRGGLESPNVKIDQMLVAFSILSFYHQFVLPDITFYLDVKVDTAINRLSQMKRDLEIYEKSEVLGKVKDVYDWINEKFADELTRADGEKSKEEITKEIIGRIEKARK